MSKRLNCELNSKFNDLNLIFKKLFNTFPLIIKYLIYIK